VPTYARSSWQRSIFLESSSSLACDPLWTPDSNSTAVGMLILENFFLHFAFAANAFFVFLALHSMQWFLSGRLQACALRVNASNIE
jgi:hypothetical protein